MTRYGGAAIVPTSFNAPDKLWAEWRSINGVLVSGGVDYFPDTAAKASGNGLVLYPSAIRAPRAGNVVSIINNTSKYYVPALNIPTGVQDMTLITVIQMPDPAGARHIFMYGDFSTSGPEAARAYASADITTELRSPPPSSSALTKSAVFAGFATLAFSLQRSKGFQAIDVYKDGVNAVTSRPANPVSSGVFTPGLPFCFCGSNGSGANLLGGKFTAARLYLGFMTPAEIAAASADIWAQNTPTP